MEQGWKYFIAIGGVVISYLFGGWYAALGVLVTLVVIDYVTGMIAGGAEGKLSSSVGFRGVRKKIVIFMMVAVAHLIDCVLGDSNAIRDAATYFYIANELLSITENAGRIGLPVPTMLLNAVAILKNKGNSNDAEE